MNKKVVNKKTFMKDSWKEKWESLIGLGYVWLEIKSP